ncbi:ATP-dependent RNA helicase ddx3x [Mortierella sp. GBA30]|nr:ATP-dependent RNA helicase ddx3x [Mortierella sp. GBA30]
MESVEDEVTQKWGAKGVPVTDDSDWAWASEKPVYEWEHDFTDETAPSIPELESELFGDDFRIGTGKSFADYEKISVSLKGGPGEHRPMDSFTYKTRARPVVIYGGADMRQQREQLARGCDILIATPGRLMDAMERGVVALDKVRYLVLDEADRILDLGFEPTIRHLLQDSDLPRDEGLHTMMFSATFPKQVQVLARDFMKDDYCRLRIGRIGGTTRNIMQKVIWVEEHQKEDILIELLFSQPPSRTLIFVDTKRKADYLDDQLYNRHFPCVSLHGDRSQREREMALEAFRIGKSPILIATAVAARGLDIKDVLHVINYDLCDDIDEYVHRIGRTARAGNLGLATTFYNDKSHMIAGDLTKLLLECDQNVPEFLRGFVREETSYEDDFVDADAFAEMGLEDHDALDNYSYNVGPTDDGVAAPSGWD